MSAHASGNWGAVAEFDSAAAIYQAAKKIVDRGYTRVDAHTPFPVHGLDGVLRHGVSHVGWICAGMGLLGIGGAQLMMWWMNAVDYEIWVAGKTPCAWPATIPITFECMVLLASFGAVFGMLALNKLPRLNHPIFTHSTFHGASDDRFFLSIEAVDPKFDSARTLSDLSEIGGRNVELLEDNR